MADYYLSEIQDYLELLCEQHVSVAHRQGGKRGFARLLSDEEISTLATTAGSNVVVVARYSGRALPKDEGRVLQNVSVYFASHAKDLSSRGINEAVARSFRIMLDFIARMRNEQGTVDYCDGLSDFDLLNLSWDEIPDQPFLENHYGWELLIPIKTYLPDYDAERWTNGNG